MFERIIVGFDDSPRSRAALRVARTIGGDAAAIHVVHVTAESPPDAVPSPPDSPAVLNAARDLLAGRPRTVFETVTGVTVSSALRRLAAMSQAELLVLGGPDLDGADDDLSPSTVEASLREAPFAVLVCAGVEPETIRSIAVIFEDTKDGWRTVRRAGALAKLHGAELTVLDRLEAPRPLASAAAVAQTVEHQRQVLRTVRVMVSDVPVVRERLVLGDEARRTGDLVADADLLIAPARPSIGMLRLLLSRDPDQRTCCPLLVLP